MVYSLLFSLPGTPVLFYGEEIGMGENLAVEGRFAVRTPMQWTPDAHGGFSTGDPKAFPAPLVTGDFGPEHVNVRDQQRDGGSLLWWIRSLVDNYRSCPELAWGAYTVLDPGPDARPVLAHRCDDDGEAVIVLHNLSDADLTAAPLLADLAGASLVDVLDPAADPVPVDDEGRVAVTLEPYGCRWFRRA